MKRLCVQPSAGDHDFLLYEEEGDGRTLGLLYGTDDEARKLAALFTAAPEMVLILRGLIEDYDGRGMLTPEEDARWETASRLLERLDRGDLA